MARKRLLIIGAATVGVLLLLGLGVFLLVGRSGSGTIENWVGSQIQTIANGYLNPKLSFQDLDYEYPLTVSLQKLRLTADDPSNPGKTIDVIACDKALVTLGEIPAIGKPIVIEKIVLDKPLFSAVATAQGSGEFVGFSNLIKGADPNAPKEQSSSPSKLSDAFRMRLVELKDGQIVYDPRIPGTVPMMLDQINTTLHIEPSAAGTYKINTVIARKPVFEVSVDGDIDLDTFTASNVAIKLLADLGSDKLDYLPPELQTLLKQYDAKGRLSVLVSGNMPVMDPLKGTVTAQVTLDKANVASGEFQLPVDNVSINAAFADGKIKLPSLKIEALGGTVNISGSATLNERLDSDLHVAVSGLMLERMLKVRDSAPLAKLGFDLKVAGSLMAIIGKVPGPRDAPLASIALNNFKLDADDPMNPGQKVDIVAIKSLDVAMTQPIQPDKPIVIDKIILDHPSLAAVAVGPNSPRYLGVPTIAMNAATATTAPAEPAPAATPQLVTGTPMKLSDLIRVKTFQLKDSSVVYDPRIPNTQRMTIGQISTSVDADANDPGLYHVGTVIRQGDAFQIDLGAKINIDHPAIDDLKFKLLADLTKGDLDFLPPQAQLLVKQNQARGKLEVNVGGSIPLMDPKNGNLAMDVTLDQIQVTNPDLPVPLKSFNLHAKLADKKFNLSEMHIAALSSDFNVTGSVDLSDRMPASFSMKLQDVVLEQLVSAIDTSGKPPLDTKTFVTADIELNSSLGVLLGFTPKQNDESAAKLAIKGLRLTTRDPIWTDKLLDFASVDNVAVSVAALPSAGQPVVIDKVQVDHPAIHAVTLEPAPVVAAEDADPSTPPAPPKPAPKFAGIANLQAIAERFSSPTPEAPKPSTTKLSELFRATIAQINDASLYYDPRIDDTVPMSLDQIGMTVQLDPNGKGELYTFALTIPHAPAFQLGVNGRLNVDSLVASDLKVSLHADLADKKVAYLPPELHQTLDPFNLEGTLATDVVGSMFLLDPLGGDMTATVKIEAMKVTAGQYRIPFDHIRLGAHLKDRTVDFLKADELGGAMVDVFRGTVDLNGNVALNDRLEANLHLNVKGVRLEDLAACQFEGEKRDLVGLTQARVDLVDAPLLVIMDKAMPAPPATPNGETATTVAATPTTLPARWGDAVITITGARLAGLEVVQFMVKGTGDFFANLFNKGDERHTNINPAEEARFAFKLENDYADFSEIYYEGELIAAQGTGRIYLNQALDLKLAGGPIAKLGGKGRLGDWLARASNSLLTYVVKGTVAHPEMKIEGGDLKPIKNVADTAGSGVKKGANAAGSGIKKGFNAIGNILNRGKKKDQQQDE